MNIWLIDHYAVPTKYYALSRPATFAKYLMKEHHEVTIFCASTVHNSVPCINLIEDDKEYEETYEDNIHYVIIKVPNYEKNDIHRIINMFAFARKLPRVCALFPKPDAIVSTSVTPMACYKGILLAKRYGCRGIAQIADLWPESFVALGYLKKHNPVLLPMYAYEKKMYAKADAIIFTMEGGKDYIVEKGWDKEHGGPIDLAKVHYINNGVDLDEFDFNAKNCIVEDLDLGNPELFTVVYTGAIRMANGLGLLVESAKLLSERKDIKILIWGSGEDEASLRQQVKEAQLQNVEFRGRVDKKFVPSIVTRSSLNLHSLDPRTLPLLKYGGSFNKLFEYLAAGKPIMSTVKTMYSPLADGRCGIEANETTPEYIANTIVYFADMSTKQREEMGKAAREIASDYDFKRLTENLIQTIEGCKQ